MHRLEYHISETIIEDPKLSADFKGWTQI
ncbi:hypothetical protein RDI58_017727 [Solanum bulbocastanum]|uniref:Uncharacterized protein n=1 Tax=Solanum bulbocastanum TaxID=147425 RepID=A0AAN8YCA1_SOLBU